MALIAAVALLAANLVSIEASIPVQDHANVAGQEVKPHKIAALQQPLQQQSGSPEVSDVRLTPNGLSTPDMRLTKNELTHRLSPPKEEFSNLLKVVPPRKEEKQKFLNKEDLKPITSIHCLQEKQIHPNRACIDPPVHFGAAQGFQGGFEGLPGQTLAEAVADINMGHFPHWQQPVCHSHGEFMCDPSNLLGPKARLATQVRLQGFKERNVVNCGAISGAQGMNGWIPGRAEDRQPFNLAVMVVDTWPSGEMDPRSVESFGSLLMSQWGLMPISNGIHNGNDHTGNGGTCQNTATLFILPKYHEAFIISPSCEFICASKGGPEVIAATLAGLDRGGLGEAVLSGLDQIQKVLEADKPSSLEKAHFNSASDHLITLGGSGRGNDELMKAESTWVWIIRLGYIFTIGLALFCIAAFVYFVLLPQGPQTFRSVSSMQGVNARKTIQGHMAQGQ